MNTLQIEVLNLIEAAGGAKPLITGKRGSKAHRLTIAAHDLQAAGLVTSERIYGGAIYRLTDAGRATLESGAAAPPVSFAAAVRQNKRDTRGRYSHYEACERCGRAVGDHRMVYDERTDTCICEQCSMEGQS